MRIIPGPQLGVYTLQEDSQKERERLEIIASGMRTGNRIHYRGGDKNGQFLRLRFRGKEEELILVGSTERDNVEVFLIRQACIFGKRFLTYLGHTTIGGKLSLAFATHQHI